MKKFLLLGVLAVLSCRTHIPVVVQQPPQEQTKQTTCAVRDVGSAINLPSGAEDLGKVEVERQEEDEETHGLLHEQVCARGGDAISGVRWEVEFGLPKPRALSGNAWKLPQRPE